MHRYQVAKYVIFDILRKFLGWQSLLRNYVIIPHAQFKLENVSITGSV
jgi:hypothetical protein